MCIVYDRLVLEPLLVDFLIGLYVSRMWSDLTFNYYVQSLILEYPKNSYLVSNVKSRAYMSYIETALTKVCLGCGWLDLYVLIVLVIVIGINIDMSLILFCVRGCLMDAGSMLGNKATSMRVAALEDAGGVWDVNTSVSDLSMARLIHMGHKRSRDASIMDDGSSLNGLEADLGSVHDLNAAFMYFKSAIYPISSDDFHYRHVRNESQNLPDSPPITVIDPDDQPMWSSTRTVAPTPSFAIIQLHLPNNFPIKGTHKQMIQDNQFDGRIQSNSHRHVADFLKISNLFQYGENQEGAIILRTFPFSLTGETKTWMNELDKGTITLWNELREAFISRYFSPAKFRRLLNDIHNFHQLGHDTLIEAWIQMKEMLLMLGRLDQDLTEVYGDERRFFLYFYFIESYPALPPRLPVRPPVLPPRGAAVCRLAVRVIILGGIFYTREDIGKLVAYPVVANYVKLYGVPVTAFSEDGLSAIATKLADVDLKDNIVVVVPKIIREGHYICNVRLEYEWKPPRCVSCKVFLHIHEECPKNTGVGEKKTLKKPSQTSQGVLVGLKMGFKPQKEYRPILKKSTASSSDNKKKGMVPSMKVSNSNPFEVLNSVDNDGELGTNGRTTNLANNEATSSGSSFMNINNNSTRITPIIDKIGKSKELLTSEKAALVDEADNPLKRVKFLDDYDSEDEVALVDNDMVRPMASERVGFGSQSLLEQWRDSYGNGDFDED
ncbi:RNA-directed DNA polymerase, eukaryota, reverse transcriptase zinc-binding domain protein [Tanacetum coccineum]